MLLACAWSLAPDGVTAAYAQTGTVAGASHALTPGAVALATSELTPDTLETLRRALADPDPVVRAVAARSAYVLQLRQLGADIRAALEREGSDLAVVEQIRAVLLLEGAPAREVVERQLPRARADGARVYLEWLVLNDPSQLPLRLEPVIAPLHRDEVGRLAADLTQQTTDADDDFRRALLRSWLRVADGVAQGGEWHPWRIVLERHGGVTDADQSILLDALSSSDAAIRRETVWWIVRRLALGRPLPDAVLDAVLRPAAPAPSDAAGAWESFGREIAARARQGKEPLDSTALLKAQVNRHRADAQAAFLLGALTPDELRVVRSLFGEALANPAKSPLVSRVAAPGGLRTPDVLMWPGLLRTLLSSAVCGSTRVPRLGAVGVEYGPERQIRRVHVDPGTLGKECQPALAALARLTLQAPAHVAKDGLQWLVLPVFDDFLTCVADAAADGATRRDRARAAGGTSPPGEAQIQPPKKIHHVNPSYPPVEQKAGVQGVVAVESRISARGCVPSIAVVQSVSPSLDAAAVAAVLQWRFTPTLVNKEPVPIVMTVTVNFTLP